MLKRIYPAIILIAIIGCSTDELIEPTTPIDPIGTDEIIEEPVVPIDSNESADIIFRENFGTDISTSFFGRVLDSNHQPLSQAQVNVGFETTTTDIHGYYSFNNISSNENFAFIKVVKEGYIDGLKTLIPNKEGNNFSKIKLLEKTIVGTVSSGQPSSVNMGESKVEFSGSFIRDDGTQYNGEIEVMMHHLPANTSETYELMPGMLFAQQEDNSAVGLETYGMLLVKLFSPSGEQLNISPDSPSSLTFPIDASQTTTANDTIDLWYFDEELGYWKRSGSAEKQGDTYVAQVNHFSWWNCDEPIPNAQACFNVYKGTATSITLKNYYVEIQGKDSGSLIYSGHTNNMGQNCGTFPANEEVIVTVYGSQDCNAQIIHQEAFGPINDGDAFDIFVADNGLNTTKLKAQLTNCNNQPIQNGYVLIYNEYQSFSDDVTQVTISNGQLDYDFSYCGEAYNVILFDLDTNLASDVQVVEFYGDIEIGLGTLSTCNNPATTYIGDLFINSQQDLDNFGLFNYEKVAGNVLLSGNDIINLQGFANITEVTGEFIINNTNISSLSDLNNNLIINKKFFLTKNTNLTNLAGVEDFTFQSIFSISHSGNLTDLSALSNRTDFTKGLSIQFCAKLANLNGLQNVTSAGTLTITDNNSLTDLTALGNLTSAGNLTINYNRNLTSLNGFTSLTNVAQLTIISNEKLANLDGIENLNSVSSGIQISNNASLASIDALSGVTTISGYLQLYNNAINSLSGLDNLTTLIGDLNIRNNSQLSNFCAVQNLFVNGSHGGNYTVQGNALNPSKTDIGAGNCD